jgi:hypothetical protein
VTDRPILFSSPMIRALLDDRKTQTRRVLKLGGRRPDFLGGGGKGGTDWNDPTCWGWEDGEHGDWVTLEKEPMQRMGWRDCRGAYAPGDRLWVREAHALVPHTAYAHSEGVEMTAHAGTCQAAIYREGFDRAQGGIRWRPSIHMPRWASRLTLAVTDVRVQRVRDISEKDARAEGVGMDTVVQLDIGDMPAVRSTWNGAVCTDHIDAMRETWAGLHGVGHWARNHWVVALTFTVHRGNIDQMEAA